MHLLDSHLASVWLTELRSKESRPESFRAVVRRLSVFLFLEATRRIPITERPVETPLAQAYGAELTDAPVLAPILRAGLGMAEAIHPMIPEAAVRHLGFYRDHESLQPVAYYMPQPPNTGGPVFVLDPMLATGGSACAAISLVRTWGRRPEEIHLLALIGVPEGIARVESDHPGVEIWLGALDDRLNEIGYIVPGLGDAGDRQFD